MTTAAFPIKTAANRKAGRDQLYANTLVHYLGVDDALKACKENAWTGVHEAIIDQQGATAH